MIHIRSFNEYILLKYAKLGRVLTEI